MSTTTANHGFIKPGNLDEADAATWASNIHKGSHLLKNIELSTNDGWSEREMMCMRRTSGGSAVSHDLYYWYSVDTGGATWYNVGDNTMGRLFLNSGFLDWQFEHPGYYRISYNLRIQHSAVTHTEGNLRAGILFYQGQGGFNLPRSLPGSFSVVPVDTYVGFTDVYHEFITKVVEYDDPTGEVYNHGDDFTYSSSYAPTQSEWELHWGHANSNSTTATVVLNDTWVAAEFVRAL